MLEIEQGAAVRVRRLQLAAHVEHFALERLGRPFAPQHGDADRFETFADGAVAGAEARPRQGLVLPGPGRAHLVFFKGGQAGDHHAAGAVRPQRDVDVEQDAGGGVAGHPGDETLRQARIQRRCILVVVVVQEHQVEVGGIAELLAAQLAVGDHGEFRFRQMPVRQRQPDRLQRLRHQDIGQAGQVVGQLLDADGAFQVLCQQAQLLRMMQLAQHVELAFGVAGGGRQLRFAIGAEGRPVGRRGQRAIVQQFVEQQRMAGQVLGRPVAGAHHPDHPLERLRIFGQESQVGGAARDGLEKIQQPAECHGSVLHRTGDDRQAGIYQGQQLFPAGFRQRLHARRLQRQMQPLGGACRRIEFESRQALHDRLQRIGIGQPGSNRGAAVRRGADRAVLVAEDGVELAGDEAAMPLQRIHERRHVGHAHHLRHAQAIGVGGRHDMGLRIVEILQTVFQVAQEGIGVEQVVDDLRRQQPFLCQRAQHRAGRALAQAGIASAPDQLEHLCQEFDFPDAATAELDIDVALRMTGFLSHHLGTDLRMHGPDRIDRAEIQIAAVDERPHDRFQRRDVVRLAGHGACLDPGIPFPFAALDDEVLLEHVETGCERPGSAVRPQGHVDPEAEAIRRDLCKAGDEALAQPSEELMIRKRFLVRQHGIGVAVFRVQEDQVDVGRDIQFAPTQLAHPEHDEALRSARFGADRHAVQGFHLLLDCPQMRGDGEIGKQGHAGDDLGQVGPAIEVAPDQGRQQQVAHPSHRPRQRQAPIDFLL